MRTKKVLSILLSVLLLAGVLPFVALPEANAADVWDGTWDGSGFSNNHITSAKGLAQFINNAGTGTSYSGQTVYLDVDIDLNNIDFGNISGGKNVYYSRDNYFQGTFDGQGHTIYNFQMHNSDHRIGLFRSARNATFKNVTFTNVFIDDNNNNGKNGFAAVVGFGEGNLTFENVHVASGEIYGYNYVGGLLGEYGANDTVRFTNCSNGAKVAADNNRAAGLVGHSKGSVVANGCVNTGEIYAGYSDAGGMAGWIEDDESSFVNCSNTGKVSTDACAGGIVGYYGSKDQDKKMTLTGCSNTGYIESRAKVAGGIAGMLDTDAEHSIENNVNSGNVYGREDAGGIVGSNSGSGVWRNNKNSGAVRCDNDNAGGILGEVEDDANSFETCYNTGSVQGKNSVGGILGYGNAAAHTFKNCGNSGTVISTNDSAGGIYGYGGNSQPTIEQCWNVGTIRAYNDAGGILGHTNHHSFIRRCFNAGSIETYNHTDNGAHGGLVGQTSDLSGSSNDNPNMTDCYNWGPVSGGRDDGGLIGKIKDGNTPYYITNSYNAGTVTGYLPYAIIAYGGNVGNNVYYNSNVAMGTVQGTAISQDDLNKSTGFSGNYCKNIWGVKIGGSTYYYPILNWYRNLFSFESKFVDSATGTNETILKNYGESFTVPNPTRSGYQSYKWLGDTGITHVLNKGASVTAGVTPNMNQYVVTQSTDELLEIRNTSSYGITWREGATARMFATTWANGGYKNGIDYTIYNLTSGSDVRYDDNNAGGDYNNANSIYRKSYQKDGTADAVATLEVDRSKYSDIKDTGVFLEYYPFIITPVGGVRWGIELFDPTGNPKGELDENHWYADVTSDKGNTYHYEQRYGDVNGSDHRCAETDSNFTSEPTGSVGYERIYGPYYWYFKGAAPAVDESVTLRILAICCARHDSGNLQMLSEWTDLTIVGTCSHSNGHMQGTAAVAPTCTVAGNSAYWHCDACGKYFSDAAGNTEIAENSWVLPATGHAWNTPTYLWADDNGSVTATRTCGNANHPETETVATDYAVITAPGCETYGSCKYTTKAFANTAFQPQTKILSMNPLGHTYGELIPALAPTCTENGTIAYYECAVCHQKFDENKVKVESIVAETSGHVYGNLIPAVAPTCTEDGAVAYYECSVCHKKFNESKVEITDIVDPTTGHAYGELIAAVAPTCTEDGHIAYYECAVCHKFFNESKTEVESVVDAATGHTYGELIAAVAPTCTEDGTIAYYECAVCHKFFNESKTEVQSIVDAATGHSYGALIAAVAPTCTEDGHIAYYECSVCHKKFNESKTEVDSIVDAATGHAYGELIEAVAPTCTEDGHIAYYECSVCHKKFNESKTEVESVVVAATGHAYGALIAAVAPTCTEDGAIAYYECAVCHKLFNESKTEVESIVDAAKGHAYGAWIEAIPNGCFTEGALGHFHCGVCGKDFDADKNVLESLTVPAIGHHTLVYTAAKEAGCPNTTGSGNVEYWRCTVCGKYFSDEACENEIDLADTVIPAAHVPVYVQEQRATATEDGVAAHFDCELCGRHYKNQACTQELTDADLVIPATGEEEPAHNGGPCKLCGEYHDSSIWGRVSSIVHMIVYLFLMIFGKV